MGWIFPDGGGVGVEIDGIVGVIGLGKVVVGGSLVRDDCVEEVIGVEKRMGIWLERSEGNWGIEETGTVEVFLANESTVWRHKPIFSRFLTQECFLTWNCPHIYVYIYISYRIIIIINVFLSFFI